MFYLFTGTDSEKVREKMGERIAEFKNAEVIRITDAHTIADLETALQGSGMFGGTRVIVLDNICGNEEVEVLLRARLETISKNTETILIYENAPLAEMRKTLEKYAEKSERYDSPKKEKKDDFFLLVNALQQGKKKDLWVLLQREFALGKPPEAVHGSLFWAAKQMVLKSSGRNEKARKLVADLAELPHEARRNGFDLEYALEHFVLSRV